MIDSITITMEILNGELALCAFHALHSYFFFVILPNFPRDDNNTEKKIQSNTFKWLNDIGGGEKRRVFSSSALRIAFFHANNTPCAKKCIFCCAVLVIILWAYFFLYSCLFVSFAHVSPRANA